MMDKHTETIFYVGLPTYVCMVVDEVFQKMVPIYVFKQETKLNNSLLYSSL